MVHILCKQKTLMNCINREYGVMLKHYPWNTHYMSLEPLDGEEKDSFVYLKLPNSGDDIIGSVKLWPLHFSNLLRRRWRGAKSAFFTIKPSESGFWIRDSIMFYDNPYFLKDFPLFPQWFSVIGERSCYWVNYCIECNLFSANRLSLNI